jgi:RNA 2',3'-cyclic 3'-phosphodiesterase
MSETTRTFIAIAIPETLGRELARMQALLTPEIPGCRWPENLPFHLTLAFLGEIRDTDLDRLGESIKPKVALFEPFEVCLQGLGAFPNVARPRVIWAGVGAPNVERLMDLQQSVVATISKDGFPPDDLRFHPHITLGRMKPGRHPRCDFARWVDRFRGWSAGSFTVTEVVTFASTLGPNGAIYTPIGHAGLKSA